MASVSDRSQVLAEVERLQGHFACLNDELSLIVELLALEGDGRRRISDLCGDVKGDLRQKTEDLVCFCDVYRPDTPKIDAEASVLAMTCAPLIAMEIAALDLFVDTLALAEQAKGDDHAFVDEALQTARSVYNTNVSFVYSALILHGKDLAAFADFCNTDPDISASRETFRQLTNIELPEFRATVAEQPSD